LILEPAEVGHIRERSGVEVFVPEVLVAARAMNMGVGVLKPYLVQAGVESKGTAVNGTARASCTISAKTS